MKKIVVFILLILGTVTSLFAEEKVLFQADDKKNPLHIWNIELTDYWVKLSDEILKEYKNVKLTPHQKVMIMINYMSDYKIGYPSQGNPKYVIEEGVGSCGTFTNAFVALMKVNGIESRQIGLYNYPKNTGHVVAEVFYDNKWHLYDTTYSGYFTTEPENVTNPYVLSFDELKGDFSEKYYKVFYNLKRYYKSQKLASEYFSKEIYKFASPSGIIGASHRMFFNLFLDLNTKPTITKEDFGPKNQGAGYIGAAGLNQNHEYKISNLEKDNNYALVLTPNFIGGHKELENIKLIISSDCNIDKNEILYYGNDKNDIEIMFKASSNKCNITVETDLSGEFMKYLSLNKISVIKK